MPSFPENSAEKTSRHQYFTHAFGAGMLGLFTVLWRLSLSHLPPAKTVDMSLIAMIVAIALIATVRRRLVVLGVVIATPIVAFWIAATYRLPRANPVEPWIELRSIPLGGVWLALLAAAVSVFLWTRILQWLDAPERTRFLLFLVGLGPLLLASADLAFVGQARLQPLRPPNYHPYLTYPVDGTYGFKHAAETEVVDMKGTRFRQRKPDDVVRIVLCGASTVWGFGLRDEQGLASVLKSELADIYPQQKIEIITVAFPGKYQLNELIDSVVTLPHWEPDLVISMNGFNEIWYGEETNRYEGMPYIEAQMRTRSTLYCLFTRFSHIGALYFAANQEQEKPPYRLEQRDPDASPRYAAYLRATAANLKRHGIPYVYAFCPNVHEKSPRTDDEESFLEDGGSWTRETTRRRQLARDIMKAEGQFSYDVMKPLNATGGTLFLDECHLNAIGVETVANDLAARISEWCKSLPGELNR